MDDAGTATCSDDMVARAWLGIRDRVLTGFRPDDTSATHWSDFLLADPAEALAIWFGATPLGALSYAIDQDILALDRMIALQLDAVLHHPRVQALEGSWRGLHWLVHQIEDGPGDRILVRALNASWHEIARDMERAEDFNRGETFDEFERGALFQKLYEQEFGMAGGEPFGVLVADYPVQHKPTRGHPTDDKAILNYLAQIGEAAALPIVVPAAPALLETDSFDELATVDDPASPLANPDHRRWRDLRDQDHARFLAVALPRVLARPLWPDNGARGDGFRYGERAASAMDRVWMSAGYPFAAVVARAAARFSWPADTRGTENDRIGGGLVTGLPDEPHRLSQTMALSRLPVEVVFTDRQERALIEAGLLPIGALPYGETLSFGAVRTLKRGSVPVQAGAREVFADTLVATQLNALLCACRFDHYLKVMGRQAVGRINRAEDIERELRTWLQRFVNRNTMAAPETRAAHPLYDATVQVTERPGKPGAFNCAIRIQPYFQIDNVSASFTFETNITPPRA